MALISTPGTSIGIVAPSQTLNYTPGGDPVHFSVMVLNQSDRFATFHLDLLVPGHDGDTAAWYALTPEISSKKPPGDRTEFQGSIIDTPIPGFAGLVNITVRITSLELGEERRIMRLYVNPGGERPVGIKLLVHQFQGSPLETVQIPVLLENPSQAKVKTTLWLDGIAPDWMIGGVEQTVDIPARGTLETLLSIKIPEPVKAVCGAYPFVLRAVQPGGTSSETSGCLDIVAQGGVQFTCTPLTHTLPVRDRHYRWGRHGICWDATFDNTSNVPLNATLQVEGDDRKHLILQAMPDCALVKPGERATVRLGAIVPRRWLGLPRAMTLTVRGTVARTQVDRHPIDRHPVDRAPVDREPIGVDGSDQEIRVQSSPRLPLWLQGLGGCVLLYVLWWCSWFNAGNPLFSHRDAVNSVELNGTAHELISGSSDQTTITWQVGGFLNPLANQNWGRSPDTGQAIRVIRYRPVNNDWMAVGLENGEIQIRPLSSQGYPNTLSLQRDDRVMDLAFTHDSRYLFSGHGSGAVLRWPVDYAQGDRTDTATLPIQTRQFDFAVYGIALVGKAEPSLAIGGRYNRLVLWNWQQDEVINLNTSRPGSPADYITSVDAVFFQPYLLATADNQGSITLWDLKPCLISNRPCDVIDEWQSSPSAEPIRDLALSPHGCYLASAGADGRVMLWPLSSAGTRSAPYRQGIRIGRSPASINAVDIKILDDDILIAFGDDNSHVNLRRHHRIHDALCDLPTSP